MSTMLRPFGTLETLADVVGARLVGDEGARWISRVSVDSRHAMPEGTLFVALKGPRFDGHAFVEEAARRGASAALVCEGWWRGGEAPLPLLVVEDTLDALQRLAGWWRQRWGKTVVAITGSNGKTVVKELLASVLARAGITLHRSPSSYNSQVGVALSLLGLRVEHELAIIEAGISRVGEMTRLARMISADIGVLTSVGLAHAEGLPTLEITAREKIALFLDGQRPLQVVIVPESLPDVVNHELSVRVGQERLDRSSVCDVVSRGEQWLFKARVGDVWHDLSVISPARHDVENAALAITAAIRLGATLDHARDVLAHPPRAPMRLEIHTTPRGITLINDTYNADPTSAQAAIEALGHHAGSNRAVAILGDMLDLGELSDREHERLGLYIQEHSAIGLLVCLGEQAAKIASSASRAGMDAGKIRVCDTLDGLHETLNELLEPGDVVLFKASRAVGLDRAASRLLESVGPTRLYIDLEAVRGNFHAARAQLPADTRTMGVVKSFAYGNDATRISTLLMREGVDALAIAYADEGEELRRAGVTAPILVLNTLAEEADKIVRARLMPVVYTERVARALDAEAARQGVASLDAHVKVDTGMNRAGVRVYELPALLDALAQTPRLRVTGMMTHLAAADAPDEDDFTRAQLARFDEAVGIARARGLSILTRHAANSAGAWRFPEAALDMVRLGVGLYGLSLDGSPAYDAQTRCAVRFVTHILHVKEVPAGESVGYMRSWRAPYDARIATIAAGYNDGLPRYMSNGGPVLIRGQRCPIVGRVCMDATMVDVTALGDDLSHGEEVVIFGEQGDAFISPGEVAARGSTIHYELLCSISPRVRRIFVDAR